MYFHSLPPPPFPSLPPLPLPLLPLSLTCYVNYTKITPFLLTVQKVTCGNDHAPTSTEKNKR